MKTPFRIAVAGLGSWARRAYLPNLELMEDVEITALSTRTPGNMQAACNLLSTTPRTYPEFRTLLTEGGFDGLIVASSAPSHKEITAAALEAGYPVLCEKPLVMNAPDCRELAELARKQGVGLQVGLEFRHAPVLVKAADIVAAGGIGVPRLSRVRIFRDKKDSVRRNPERFTQWGGVFLEFLCHYLDVLTWLSRGTPQAVACHAGKALGTEAYDHGTLSIDHTDGAFAVLEFSLLAPRECETLHIEVLGDEGHLTADLARGRLKVSGTATPENTTMPDPGHPSDPYPGSYEQIRAFVDGVREGRPLSPDAKVWQQVMATGHAASESAETGRQVTVEL